MILLVEDDRTQRESLAATLRRCGLPVEECANAACALDWVARNGPPDALILDIVMPGLDGVELLRLLQANPEIGKTYVIITTAHSGDIPGAPASAIVVRKPFDPDQIVLLLKED